MIETKYKAAHSLRDLSGLETLQEFAKLTKCSTGSQSCQLREIAYHEHIPTRVGVRRLRIR